MNIVHEIVFTTCSIVGVVVVEQVVIYSLCYVVFFNILFTVGFYFLLVVAPGFTVFVSKVTGTEDIKVKF